jgi:Common central domain of tyrosinase
MGTNKSFRKNIAKVSDEERIRFRDAILKLNQKFYPGSRDDFRDGEPCPFAPAGHVSYWFKQDELHAATHVHGGPAFLTWHRELCNRLERDLQDIDSTLALHYWDWTTDPRTSPNGRGGTTNLFSTGPDGFMGSANGIAGAPLESLYTGTFAGSRDETGNAADPPPEITRYILAGAPSVISDVEILQKGSIGPLEGQYRRFRKALEGEHDTTHMYINGTIGDPHLAFRDPFVYLLHSNVDRIFASWQVIQGQEWRLEPDNVYGIESNTQAQGDVVGIMTPLEPWAGINAPGIEEGVCAVRPWHQPENEQEKPENQKNSRHPSVVRPPEYDEYVRIPP